MTLSRRSVILGAAALAPVGTPAAAADDDPFEIWMRTFAAERTTTFYWWFFGVLGAHAHGLSPVPAVRVNSLRVCRVRREVDSVTMAWKEIGYYGDLATAQVAEAWSNPVTGERLPIARAFEEGVGTYSFARGGAAPRLKQHASRPWRLDLQTETSAPGGRPVLVQTEVKTRAFPYADGSSPEVTQPDALVNEYRFRLSAPAHGLATDGQYDVLFGGAPPWMQFPGRPTRAVCHGVMRRTPASAQAFPAVRETLRAVHPDYFRKGEVSWD